MNRKITVVLIMVIVPMSAGFFQTDINQKLEQLDLKSASIKEVIELFGEPERYIWGQEIFQKNNLPPAYVALYPNGLQFFLFQGKISEIRHEGPTGYRFKGKLQVGSSLETALGVLGPPTQTILGQANGWADGVLYKDIDGTRGNCYYQKNEKSIRLFFAKRGVST